MMACIIALTLGIPVAGSAQRAPQATVAQRAALESVAERWLYAGLRPEHTPFVRDERWTFLDSVRVLARGGRVIFATDGSPSSGNHIALTVDANGVERSSRVTSRPLVKDVPPVRELNNYERERWISNGILLLPNAYPFAEMAWRGPLRPREAITDSIHQVNELLGMRVTLDGHRTRTVDRDTVIDGRKLWFVHERATARYTERRITQEFTLDTVVTLDRGGSGTDVGWTLVDADSGLVRWRTDSLRIVGTATWHYPDGRVFTTPLRMERWRDLRYLSARAYVVLDSTRTAIGSRRRGGMHRVPDSTQARLSRGDPGIRDSIDRAWRSAAGPEEYERTWAQLYQFADKPTKRRLAAAREASGDTVFTLSQLVDSRWESPLDSLQMSRWIAVMADPATAVRVGVNVDQFYEDMTQLLYTLPPAITPDTAHWPCTPAACRLLAQQYHSAGDARLHAVALVAHAVLDPKGWSDRLLAQPDQPLLTETRWLARGAGSTWPAAAHAPMPPPGAPALDWLRWMNEDAPEYAASMPHFARDTSLKARLRFETSHANSIRFTSVRTGRDISAELRQRYDSAVGDTARTIFGFLVQRLTGLGMTAPEIAASLRHGSATEQLLATQELEKLFARSRSRMTPVDSVTRDHLYAAFLTAHRRGGTAPWPRLTAKGTSASPPAMRLSDSTRFVLVDSVPAGIASRWADSVHFITQAQWTARGVRRAGSLSRFTIKGAIGPFIAVEINFLDLAAGEEGETHYGWRGGSSLVLLEVDGRWYEVTGEHWIT